MSGNSAQKASLLLSVLLILAFSISGSAEPDENDETPSLTVVVDEFVPEHTDGQGVVEPGSPGVPHSIGLSPYDPGTDQDVAGEQTEGSKGVVASPMGAQQKEQPLDFSALTKVAEPWTYPWCTTCRLAVTHFDGSKTYGSGVLIDPRHVLTAGHLVHKEDHWAQGISVIPAYQKGKVPPYGGADGGTLYALVAWTDRADSEYDVGIIKLARPVGALTGWLGYGANGNANFYLSEWFCSAGYPGENYDGETMYKWEGTFDSLEYNFSSQSWYGNWVMIYRNAREGQSGSGAYWKDNKTVYAVACGITKSGKTYYTRLTSGMFGWIKDKIEANTPQNPDLVPLTVKTSQRAIRPGRWVTSMTCVVHNYSKSSCTGTLGVRVYLSTNDIISSNDTLLAQHSVPISGSIASKDSLTISIPATQIPAGTAPRTEDYYLGVHLNISDADTSNNFCSKWDSSPIRVSTTAVALLDKIQVSGPTTVNENSSANYTCRAYYDDGSSADVTSSANWSENSAYASISSSGKLTSYEVSSNQSCRITATYTKGGITKSATHDITIKNVPAPVGASGGPSYSGSYGPDKAFDGSTNTWWAGKPNVGEWIWCYGFSSSRYINTVQIQWFSDQYRCANTKVSTSTEGLNWSAESSYSGGSLSLNRTARWIRIRMIGPVAAGYPAIKEVIISSGRPPQISSVEVYPPNPQPGTRLSIGRATASSSYSGSYGPEKATDGNLNTWWAGKPNQSSYWFELDLGQNGDVDYIEVVFFSSAYVPSVIRVRTKGEGEAYPDLELAIQMTGTRAVMWSRDVRYVRFDMNRPAKGHPAIREVRLYRGGCFGVWADAWDPDGSLEKVWTEFMGELFPMVYDCDAVECYYVTRIVLPPGAAGTLGICVKALDEDGNLASGCVDINLPTPPRPVGASGGLSYSASYGPEKAFDGNTNTWWAGKPNAGEWNLYYGFSSSRYIGAVQINWFSGSFACNNTRISTSTDGTTWSAERSYSGTSLTLNRDARWVRTRMIGPVTGGYPAIKEVIISSGRPPTVSDIRLDPANPQPATAVAIVKTTASSSYSAAYGAERAIDGKKSTWWAGNPNESSYWLELDLGANKDVQALDMVFWSKEYTPPEIGLRCRKDGEAWGSYHAGFDGVVVPSECQLARYIKIYLSRPAGGYPAIREVKLSCGGIVGVEALVSDPDGDLVSIWVEVLGQSYPMVSDLGEFRWFDVLLPSEAAGTTKLCVKALDEDGNLASGCVDINLPTPPPPVGASGGLSYSASYGPEKAFDGNTNTWWAGKPNAGEWNLYYGFSRTRRLNSLTIQWFSDKYKCGDTRISTSTNGTTWSAETKLSGTLVTLNRDAKYFRIHMVGNVSGGYPSIREVSISSSALLQPAYVGVSSDLEAAGENAALPEVSSAASGETEGSTRPEHDDEVAGLWFLNITGTEVISSDPLQIRITWRDIGGHYRIYWTDDLSGPVVEWQEVVDPWANMILIGHECSWIDDGTDPSMFGITPADVRCRFYRVKISY